MKCPKCETSTLKPIVIKETEVDRCKTCGGVWCDEQELIALLDLKKRELRPLAGKENELLNTKRGECPRDGSGLLRVYSPANPKIIIDACLTCQGVWLDGGELLQLLEP